MKNTKIILTKKQHQTPISLDKNLAVRHLQEKNGKLPPKRSGPCDILDIDDTNSKLKLENGKIKVVNVILDN